MENIRISFHEEIRKNKIYSTILIFVVLFFLVALVYVIGLAIGGVDVFILSILAVVISVSYVLLTYYNSDKIAIASVGAKFANPSTHKNYYDLVEGLTLASGMPMPKLYIMESEQINAFASGRSPDKAVICITTGALKKLNKQELEGVLAHEISHVANYDIRFMTITAVMVGLISIISQIFLRSLWFQGNNRNDKSSTIFMLIGIALAILAPIAVFFVQLAISRKREYGADASAVKFMRTPTGLINALEKIKRENEDVEIKVSSAIAPLFLVKPSKKTKELFQTHPDINKRIEKLKKM